MTKAIVLCIVFLITKCLVEQEPWLNIGWNEKLCHTKCKERRRTTTISAANNKRKKHGSIWNPQTMINKTRKNKRRWRQEREHKRHRFT